MKMSDKKEKTTQIVVKLHNGHPTGRMNRAGFEFLQNQPVAIDVTDEQLEIIKEDKMLQILDKKTGGRWYEQAMEQLEGKKAKKKNAKPASDETEEDSEEEEEETEEDDEEEESDEGEEETGEGEKPISRMNKTELLAALEAKGKKAGIDFDAEAKNEELVKLLKAIK